MSDTVRMGGLVSGMDIQGIIDKLLALEVKKISTIQTEKFDIEEDIAAWSDVSANMSNLTDCLDSLRSYETWNNMTATASSTTDLSAIASSSATETTYDVTISQLAQSHSVASDKANTLTGTSDDDSSTDLVSAAVLTAGHTFTIAGETITIAADESLDSLMTQINNASTSMAEADRVTASIIDNQLVIMRDMTGDTDISISNDGADTALTDLGILTAPATFKNELTTSENALFKVNNIDVTRASNTGIDDVISNVTLNLLNENSTGTLTLTISRDTETPKTAILEFIDNYNAVVAKMEQYTTITLRGSDEPIVGALQDDPLVSQILTNLRRMATDMKSTYLDSSNASYTYNSNTGIANSLSDVGVWTEGKANVLSLVDEDRLDYMLANNYGVTEQLFRGVFDADDGFAGGVAKDLYDYSYGVSSSLTGQIDMRKSRLEVKSEEKTETIEKMFDDLDYYEDRLWRDFGMMEGTMSRMQQDMAWLTSQMSPKAN